MKTALSVCCVLWFTSFSLFAQSGFRAQQAATPLGNLLNPDGTLKTNTGFNGSLDPRGWKMATGKSGAPRFVPSSVTSVPADSAWDNQFALPDLDGTVWALAVSGTDLYAAGSFSAAGGVVAFNIAKWDGSSWSALGSGINSTVFALAVVGTDIYAGGTFNIAGGVTVNNIAKWNGASWAGVGGGVNGAVYWLVQNGTDVYAGGSFTTAGGVSANNIAKWNGSAWSALGSGMNGEVYILAVGGTDLYAGGNFTTAGGGTVNYVAKWDGSSWSALGSGMNQLVTALALGGTDIYAGGSFTTAGGASANFVAKWNGSTWSALGTGTNGSVGGLVVSGTDIFAGGIFTTAGGGSANHMARWDGSSWSALGTGTDGYVNILVVKGTDIVAGGNFSAAGGANANFIAKWNGSSWFGLDSPGLFNGVNRPVYAVAVSGTDFYVGGIFTTAGGASENYIAKWNGSSWTALGSGMNDNVHALAVSGTDVYAGGGFTTAGGVSANHVAKWDGSSWSALGTGVNSVVYALAVGDSGVYAGGNFAVAGGVSANYIAKWDGSAWSALGSGMDAPVFALASSGTDVYAGGQFTTAGGVSANLTAKWDGSSWSAVGSGMNTGISNYVAALVVSGTDLYAGGIFITAGGVTAHRIAKWDGSTWSALGSGMDGDVYALAISGRELYAGGSFTAAGGVISNGIARWDGSNWSALGSGEEGAYVDALALRKPDLYAGGPFVLAGDKPAGNFSRYAIGFTIVASAGTHGTISPSGVADVAAGSNPGVAFSPNTGYHVDSVFVDGSYIGAPSGYTFTNVTTDHTISVTFAINTYTLTITATNGSVTKNPDQPMYTHGSSVQLTAVPSSGFHFKGWGGDTSGFANPLTVPMVTNRAITANFGHTISPSAGVNGSISPSTVVNVAVGGNQNFTFSPIAHYHVDTVFVDGSPVGSPSNYMFTNVTIDHTISVKFAIDTYSITATAGAHGTINPPGVTTVNYDGNQLYTITPDSGSAIVSVTADSVNVGKVITYNFAHVQRNHTIAALFSNLQTLPITVGNRWNLLSVPLLVSNYSKDSLYPPSVSSAFAYQGTYVVSPTLANGPGYWLIFNNAQTVSMTGVPEATDSIDVIAGWNLIGSISSPLAVTRIGSIPAGIVTSRYFGYTGSYIARDTIEPGKGYWVKVNQPGKLILSSIPGNVPSGTLTRIQPSSELPPAPPGGTASKLRGQLPGDFGLGQNYPNPFNPTTVIDYQLTVNAHVEVKVYDMLGQEVGTLVNEMQDAGFKSIVWDASHFPSAVYYYRVTAGSFSSVKKMILIK
jgi:hypothetical protein